MTDDILTVEEIAKYLKTTNETVIDWAEKKEIPAGKIGNQWRFKKSEVERWVNARLSPTFSTDLDTEVKLKNIISPDRIVFITQSTKHDALVELSSALSTAPQIKKASELTKEILNREELMSTAIGCGVAIPHVRLASVTDLVMAIGICKKPLIDYEAMDNQSVDLLIMIAAASNQHSYYLKTISHISSILKQDDLRASLVNASTSEEVYNILISN